MPSFDRGREQSPLHLVSAWVSDHEAVLGQRRFDGKSDEMTAIPELLDSLTLKNTLVTLDTRDCQKVIAQPILARKVDSLLGTQGQPPQRLDGGAEPFRSARLPV